jgi:hypothetical protein
VAQTMYTHVSKYKNDKINGEKKKEKIKITFFYTSLHPNVSQPLHLMLNHRKRALLQR